MYIRLSFIWKNQISSNSSYFLRADFSRWILMQELSDADCVNNKFMYRTKH